MIQFLHLFDVIRYNTILLRHNSSSERHVLVHPEHLGHIVHRGHILDIRGEFHMKLFQLYIYLRKILCREKIIRK